MGSKTDASGRRAGPREIATNLAEIFRSGRRGPPARQRHTCRLHLDLRHKCRISMRGRNRQQMQDVYARQLDPTRGPANGSPVGLARRRAAAVSTISDKFVRQLFVYEMIVGIGLFGRSPSHLGFAARRRLATLNDRDYDPSSAPGGLHPARPWPHTPGRLAPTSAKALVGKPLCMRAAEQEGYPV